MNSDSSTDKQKAALQAAFEAGQQAWREGKRNDEFPYPQEAVNYRDQWLQGWQAERAVHFED